MAYWSGHLTNTEQNETAELIESPFVAANDHDAIYESLQQFQDIALLQTNGTNGFYHLNIDPDGKYQLSPQQWAHSIAIAEKVLGYEGQPRLVMRHVKDDREHYHVMWQRAQQREDGTFILIDDGFNYPKHEFISRTLEAAFGHEHVKGAFTLAYDKENEQVIERPRDENGHYTDNRPGPSMTQAEWQQQERSGLLEKDRKAEISALYQEHNQDGAAFKAALENSGYQLARGDKKNIWMVVDRAGDAHRLAQQVNLKGEDGKRLFKKADIDNTLAGFEIGELPTASTLREQIQSQENERDQQEINDNVVELKEKRREREEDERLEGLESQEQRTQSANDNAQAAQQDQTAVVNEIETARAANENDIRQGRIATERREFLEQRRAERLTDESEQRAEFAQQNQRQQDFFEGEVSALAVHLNERTAQERTERAGRFKTGIAGWIQEKTGRAAQIGEENAAQELAGRQRDIGDRNALIANQDTRADELRAEQYEQRRARIMGERATRQEWFDAHRQAHAPPDPARSHEIEQGYQAQEEREPSRSELVADYMARVQDTIREESAREAEQGQNLEQANDNAPGRTLER